MAQSRPAERTTPPSAPSGESGCGRCGCTRRRDAAGNPLKSCPRCGLRRRAGRRPRPRPRRIRCRRCGRWQRTARYGRVATQCWKCNRRCDPARPTRGRCQACRIEFWIAARGPVPAWCADCGPRMAVRLCRARKKLEAAVRHVPPGERERIRRGIRRHRRTGAPRAARLEAVLGALAAALKALEASPGQGRAPPSAVLP